MSLPQVRTGLSRDFVANVSKIFRLEKSLLSEKFGSVPRALMDQVETRLILWFCRGHGATSGQRPLRLSAADLRCGR